MRITKNYSSFPPKCIGSEYNLCGHICVRLFRCWQRRWHDQITLRIVPSQSIIDSLYLTTFSICWKIQPARYSYVRNYIRLISIWRQPLCSIDFPDYDHQKWIPHGVVVLFWIQFFTSHSTQSLKMVYPKSINNKWTVLNKFLNHLLSTFLLEQTTSLLIFLSRPKIEVSQVHKPLLTGLWYL